MNYTAIFIRIASTLTANLMFRILLVLVVADMLFGTLRAIRERRINSAIGIDGGIRKVTMILGVIVLVLVDIMLRLNVFSLLPLEMQDTLSAIGLAKLGIAELFAILYILYEALSVLKNMLLCGVPIPKGMRAKLEKWMNAMTDETDALESKE